MTTTPATIPRVSTASLRQQLSRMESRELTHAAEVRSAKAQAKANELRATRAEAVAKVAEANFQRLVTREKRREDAARAAAALPAIPVTNPPAVYQPRVEEISPPQEAPGSDAEDDRHSNQDEFDYVGAQSAYFYDNQEDQHVAEQQAAEQVQQCMAGARLKRPAPMMYYQGQVRNPSSYLTAHWSTYRPEDVKTDSARAITDLDRHVVTGDRKIIKRMMVLAHESRCSIIRAGIKINSTLDTRSHARSVSDLMGDLEKPVMGKFFYIFIN